MVKFLLYSFLAYTVYSYFARLGSGQARREQQRRKQSPPPKKTQRYSPDEEYVDYEEVKK